MSANASQQAAPQRWARLLETLDNIVRRHPDAVFASSLAAEDMVLTHAIAQQGGGIGVFTLDTGRLHAETLGMIEVVRARYNIVVQVFQPIPEAVERHVQDHGAFAFYESVDLRKACCQIRKVEPLKRALAGKSAWLTGQRKEQAVTRAALPEAAYDDVFGLHKFNPLAEWTHAEVWETIQALDIPYNPLHDQGYPSIGCDPCTRAVRQGEDLRAGRWWWENADAKECGLHAANSVVVPLSRHARVEPQADTPEQAGQARQSERTH
jgi:phosphoadenosine phosphosulfate reductase